MKFAARQIARLFLCAALLPAFAYPFETDQYNLPPEPLADIGAEVSEYAEQNISRAIEKINRDIAVRQSCLENDGAKSEKLKCDSPEKELEKLAALQSDDAIARAVFNELGAGFPPYTKSGSWMESHEFKAKPARYKTGFRQSIFASVPSNYLSISSTVNLYDAQFGTDKIAHVFQQGFSYYRIYKRALASGATEEQAIKRAVDWGKLSEKTYYGFLVSGVYSNADLCANYAGMKFYFNLARDVKIGTETKSAILIIKNGVWIFNESTRLPRENLLKSFLSNHFNEALNPSVYVAGLRSFARKTVKKQSCKLWRERFPDQSKTDYENKTRALELWHGEDYGFKRSGKFITIANACF